ncbi:hypothetical protein WR25_10027 [Diploscapter pachys]|uniref:Uncharacterized protein n=1 Tax=Diploscapter pachys TaxID=2018661 RepID=A0A2A2KDM5_9BILA|nr:hypothetical protein WR25_10027 [Diploscapter pachys]
MKFHLIGVAVCLYGSSLSVKIPLIIWHRLSEELSPRLLQIIVVVIASKQFILAIGCEVLIEVFSFVPKECSGVGQLHIWIVRSFFALSMLVNIVFTVATYFLNKKIPPKMPIENSKDVFKNDA